MQKLCHPILPTWTKITVLFSTSTPRMKADLKGTGVPNKLASGAHSSFWFYIFISTVPPPEGSLPQLVKKKCSACLNKEPFTTSLSNLFIFLPNVSKSGLFHVFGLTSEIFTFIGETTKRGSSHASY